MTMTQADWNDLYQLQQAGLTQADVQKLGNALANPPPAPAAPSQNGSSTMNDARAVVNQTLQQYGLQSLGNWAWGEITSGASTNQVLLDMYQTPQFNQRFPAIKLRQQAGLPTISPADYVNYEDSIAQMESQYGLPKGSIDNQATITKLIAGDTSTTEAEARLNNEGFQQVAYAPPEVRSFFSQISGAQGDSALAAYFINPEHALPLLEQQATAATLGGTLAQGGVNMSTADAMRLAQMGVTQSAASSQAQNLEQTQDLYQGSVTEGNGVTAGAQGVEAAFGLSAAATAAVNEREAARQAAFKGGGAAYEDQYGLGGAGAARPT